MAEHFDEIVEFAGIEKFLDSPIKNFSSGMKARLGFAVATVVKPDVLIVDEVLAVGDVRFRKKCMKRMEELLDGGTTLLFVSHNIEQVRSLCTHALWLDHGDTVMSGPAEEVCAKYIEAMEAADVKETKSKNKQNGLKRNGEKQRMDIKQVLLPEAIDTDELLYYRKDEELVETGKDGSLIFHKGGAADFNTFFNSFSIGKWRKYTVLETVSLSLKLQEVLRFI